MTGTCECLQCSSHRRSGNGPVASQFLCCRCNLQHWFSAGPALPGGFLSLCPFLGPCPCEWSLHLTRHQRRPSSTSTCPQNKGPEVPSRRRRSGGSSSGESVICMSPGWMDLPLMRYDFKLARALAYGLVDRASLFGVSWSRWFFILAL